MRVLFLSRWYPYPADNGARLRIYHLIKHLAQRHEVSLVSFTAENISDDRLEAMRALCSGVATIRYRPFQPGRAVALLGFLSSSPRSVVDTHSEEMACLVAEQVARFKPHSMIASEIDMAPYARRFSLPKIAEEIEIAAIQEAQGRAATAAGRWRAQLTWFKLVTYVRSLLRDFNGCTVVSQAERERLVQAIPSNTPVEIIPNGVDVAACAQVQASPQPDTLIYSGALTYGANFDAVNYFLREIFPLVLARNPGARLLVTGKLDGVPMHQLPRNDRVTFTGYLDDVRPTVAGAWASIVPLRVGGGTRLKILESMALGTPVVSTSKGAEGLNLTNGRDVLIADEPRAFADGVVSLLADAELRTQIGSRARDTVAATYDWRVIGNAFCDFVERMAECRAEMVV